MDSNELIKQRVAYKDPVVEFFKQLNFEEATIFKELDECDWNQEKYQKYFSYPDLFVLRNAIGILNGWHGHAVCDSESDESKALVNMLKWMLVKIATHPYWFQRLGWLNRFIAAHTVPTSYWPMKFSPFFVPNNWKSMYDDWSIKKTNDEGKPFEDIFKWETNEERLAELLECSSKEWIMEQLNGIEPNEDKNE
jgi:hypothetical protein